MYRSTAKTRANAEQKKLQILDACRRVVTRGGFAAASVAEVAKTAGVSSGSIYTYFANREELLRAMFVAASTHELAAVEAAISRTKSSAECVEVLIATFVTRAQHSQQLAHSLLFASVGAGVQEERLRFRTAYAETLARHLMRTAERDVVDSQFVTALSKAVIGSVTENLIGVLHTPEQRGGQEILATVIRDLTLLWLPTVTAIFSHDD